MPSDDAIIDSIEQLEAQAEALVAGLRDLKAQVAPGRSSLPTAERRPGLPEVEEPERAELPRPPRPHVEGELADEEAWPSSRREPIIAPAAPVIPELEVRTGLSQPARLAPRRKRLLGLFLLGAVLLLCSLALSSPASLILAWLAAAVALLALALFAVGWPRRSGAPGPRR